MKLSKKQLHKIARSRRRDLMKMLRFFLDIAEYRRLIMARTPDLIEAIIVSHSSYTNEDQREKALRDYQFLKERSKLLTDLMNRVVEAKQLDGMGSFDNWVSNSISARKERDRFLEDLKKAQKQIEELQVKKLDIDMWERMERLERWVENHIKLHKRKATA